MTQKEKAKRYDEVLESIKELYSKGSRVVVSKEEFENIFPELKESEDESIRKGIRSILEHYKESGEVVCPYPFVSINEALAWLEKQGEQKPADNGEPKFKVGEWIVDGSGFTQQVLNFVGEVYICTYNSFSISCESNYRLWTLADAKDGDILTNKANDAILIFKTIQDNYLFSSYCDYFVNTFRPKQFSHWASSAFIPATKEQRDTLFAKMHEAGFEWDETKKELKKIEEVSAWSEEDDYNLRCCIAKAESDISNGCLGRNKELIEWLKSIKQRIEEQQ